MSSLSSADPIRPPNAGWTFEPACLPVRLMKREREAYHAPKSISARLYSVRDGSFYLACSRLGLRGKPHPRRRAALRSRQLFAFNCFDGSRGAGRINGDGSVVGTIQFRGAGPARTVSLPAGTLRVRGEAVCASLKGMAFEACFALEKTTERSFRGSWMGFAYCDFTQRISVAGISSRRNSSEPLSLEAAAPSPSRAR